MRGKGSDMVRTTVVGSWPIPFSLKRYLTSYYKGDLTDETAAIWLQRAARISMDEMIGCGLDQIMGGEVFAPDFIHHLPPRLAGLETIRPRDHRAGYAGVGVYQIVGDISAPDGLGHAKAFRRERAIEPRLDKASVPSPWTVAEHFETDPRLQEQMENVARMVEREVLDMVDAQVGEIQLDAPNEAIAMIEDRRGVDEIARWLIYPFRNVSGIRRSVHFCLGDNGRKPATQAQHLHTLIPLIEALEGHVDRVHLECSYAGQWDDRSCLSAIPDSIEVIAGIADVKSPPESTDVLRAKIEALLDVLPPERLLVSSSCGCGRVPHDEAIELMRNLVSAAT
jgi:5-methyltetrahydropteroyltriglutamate--homocysteine methyltransferase